MKRWIISGIITTSLMGAPALHADGEVTPAPTEETTQGTLVGQGSDEAARTAKRKQWQNIAIAAGAVALAVTALVLVASNDGHK